jgi:hypothetical protein
MLSQMHKVYYTAAENNLFQIPQRVDSGKNSKVSLRETKKQYEKKDAVQQNYGAVKVIALLMDTVRFPAQ